MEAKALAQYNRLQLHEIKSLPDTLYYATIPSNFGRMVIAGYREGICFAGFEPDENPGTVLQDIKHRWPDVELLQNQEIADLLHPDDGTLHLYLYGTPFRQTVWHGLCTIPNGKVCTYSELAERIGLPRATRAVASAVGANPISWFIPCHRVVRKGGEIGQYHWGESVKRAILLSERDTATNKAILCF